MKQKIGIIILLLLQGFLFEFVTAKPARAETVLYVYVDENGNYHFSPYRQDGRYRRVQLWKNKAFVRDFNAGKYDSFIALMGSKYRIDPALIKAVIRAESDWNQAAVSNAGAMGLMQLMPGTAKKMDVENPFDPAQNIEAGARYLRLMLDTFNGDVILALAAYNAGPNAVKKYNGIPPYEETRTYVQRVLKYYREYLK